MQDSDVRKLVGRAESLLEEIESLADEETRSLAIETIQVILELHREGLVRILDQANRKDPAALQQACRHDELVSHLLMLHELHPDNVEVRVQQALEEVRPYMESHGGNVELLGVEGGVAQLKLVGSCDGCAASSTTLKFAVEKAVHKFAPDLLGIQAVGAVDPQPETAAGFVPMTAVGTAQGLKQHA